MAEESGRSSDEFKRIKDDFVNVVTKDKKKTTFYVCKFIEVIFCIVTYILLAYPMENYKIRQYYINHFSVSEAAVFTPIIGFILINIILAISYALGEELPKKMLIMFSGAGAISCCIGGVMILAQKDQHFSDIIPDSYLNSLTPCGILTVLASLTFALDTLLTYKYA